MPKTWKIVFFAFLFITLVIQLVRPSMTNPPVDPAREITASHPMTPEVTAMLWKTASSGVELGNALIGLDPLSFLLNVEPGAGYADVAHITVCGFPQI